MFYNVILRALNQLEPSKWLLLITFTLSTIVSGGLMEMIFDTQRYWEISTGKVVFTAFCKTLPVWSINSLMMWALLQKGDVQNQIKKGMIMGGIISSIIFLIIILMAVDGLVKSENAFVTYIIFCEALLVAFIILKMSGIKTNITMYNFRRIRMHVVLAVLNLVACFFILQIVFGLCPLISCDLSKERVDLINGFVVDMSVGILTSTFFYYLLVYLPEKRRRRQVRLLNQDKINFLCGLMQVVVGYFCDKYHLHCNRGDLLDADFSKLPLTQNFGEEPMLFWFKREMVSDYSGSTEIGFLNYYLMNIKEHASMLYASNAMTLDDLELLSLITRIKDSKLISSVELLNVNRKLGILIPALPQQTSVFFDLYKSLAVYAEIKDISLKGEKPDNIIPIVYQ